MRMRLDQLKTDPANRRQHNARNLEMLSDALRAVGASRSIVIDEGGEILAGNGVVEAATAIGITRVQVVEADGQTLIAVRRSGLTPDQKRDLALYDNRTGELSAWNVEQLAADLENGADLSAFFFDGELAALGVLGPGQEDPQAEYQGLPEFSQADETAFHSIHVHFKDAAALEAFAILLGRALTKTVRYLWFPDEPKAVFRNKRYRDAAEIPDLHRVER